MKKLLVSALLALSVVFAFGGAAQADSRFSFGFSIGPPVYGYYAPAYPYPYYYPRHYYGPPRYYRYPRHYYPGYYPRYYRSYPAPGYYIGPYGYFQYSR